MVGLGILRGYGLLMPLAAPFPLLSRAAFALPFAQRGAPTQRSPFPLLAVIKAQILREEIVRGSATLNRGQAAHSISNSQRGLRPRHLGNSAGGTGKVNNSSIVQR